MSLIAAHSEVLHRGLWQGAEQTLDYGDPRAERLALATGCALIDLSARSQIRLGGAQRVSFLHNMCTADIKYLASGRGCEAFFLNAKGHVLGYATIFARDESLVIDTVPGQTSWYLAHLERYIVREDVQLSDPTAEPQSAGQLLVAGPRAEGVLRQICSALPPAILDHGLTDFGGQSLWIRRVPWVDTGAWSVVGDLEGLRSLAQSLIHAGGAACGQVAFESARLTAGIPVYGLDITDHNLPQEVNRDAQTLCFTKGCYLGQETVARIDALGHVNKLLVRVQLEGGTLPPPGTALTSGDTVVGEVTSSAVGLHDDVPLAFAYVRRAQAGRGAQLLSPHGPATVL